MAFTYKPLWKMLIDKELSKKELIIATGISKSTVEKMSRGENVSLDVIDKLCSYFNCGVEDVIAYCDTKQGANKKHD